MSTKHNIKPKLNRFFYFWLLLLGINNGLIADECQNIVARIVSLQGQVEVRSADSQEWHQVQSDSEFCPGDRLRVNANSRAGLHLKNNTFLRLSERSNIRFATPADEKSSWLDLLEGIAHFISRITLPAQVNTPYVNASIEGTEFTVQVDVERSRITVTEGRVRAYNNQGESILGSGQMAETSMGKPPVVSTVVNPLDAVQWALYYPPIIDVNKQDIKANGKLRRSYDAYRKGDVKGAFGALNQPGATEDTLTLAYRASLNLAVGRIGAARDNIRQLLEQDPQNADALALRSVIATIQNRPQEALDFAQQSVESNPQSVTGHLALSYAKQARFELEAALEAAKQATRLDPQNAIAWARLSQLHLMFRQMNDAIETANKAVVINPEIALSQTTLGFAHLIRLDLDDARQAFKKAAALDQAAPMPRLGLGLVLIRQGDLVEGRLLLETAVHLDPGSALIRSYLGKAYYEEKRNQEASKQFQLAKQRDPLDPTAWFYDAILKQSENRPTEALADIQHAIDLNDNRAVYRSRLQLDEDQASRNISQARIYNDLGFQQLARKESAVSLSSDPGNASAHRFLSDAYSGVVLHETAQVSELLQAQLLQQEITVPVSPSASETGLQAFSGSGPSVSGFNEYNPMFNRQHMALLANVVTGGNNTRGSEIAVGGFTNRGMLSAGHYRESTDSFRENNNRDQTISNLFGQLRITPELAVQGEVRKREGDFRDLLEQDTPIGIFTIKTNRSINSDIYRLGANYSPSTGHSILISAIHEDLTDNTDAGATFTDTSHDRAQYEGQYISQGKLFHLVSGLRLSNSDSEITITAPNIPPFPLINTNSQENDGRAGYVYTHIPWSNVTGILGLEYAEADDSAQIDESQANPKLGAIWNISEASTLRLAAFKTLQTYFIEQSLTPTQVAGFNQIFDDPFGAEAWRYGIAFDSQIMSGLYGGIELTRRTVTNFITRPTEDPNVLIYTTEDHDEENHTAYLSWSLTNNFAVGSYYNYDNFEREYIDREVEADRPVKMNTQTLSMFAKYHHNLGFYSTIEAVHVSQETDDTVETTSGLISESDRFWLTNISLGMRLPKKTGIVELQVSNLFDRDFNFQSINPRAGTPQTSNHYPERFAMLRAQLWF
jgi:tetratricopeptide (TPR) repeat protein